MSLHGWLRGTTFCWRWFDEEWKVVVNVMARWRGNEMAGELATS